MKPIILKVDSEGKLLISADEIQKMVEDAYNAGFAEGKNQNNSSFTTPYWNVPQLTEQIHLTCGTEGKLTNYPPNQNYA